MPDFIIIGAQKCGTTFLYDLITRHPQVEPAARREMHYFDLYRHYCKGARWYRSHFPSPTGKGGRKSITGEKSPYYLFHPHAAVRVAKLVPEVRLIVLLRNPVDRAYSHYYHTVYTGHEPLTIEDAFELEEVRLRGERDKMLEDERYDSYNYQKFSYLSRGIYVDQLMEWSKFFGSNQMLVLKSEDLFQRMPDALEPIWSFLGLPHWEPQTFEAEIKGSRQRMKPAMRQQLRGYFEPHNKKLYKYLSVDFGW